MWIPYLLSLESLNDSRETQAHLRPVPNVSVLSRQVLCQLEESHMLAQGQSHQTLLCAIPQVLRLGEV